MKKLWLLIKKRQSLMNLFRSGSRRSLGRNKGWSIVSLNGQLKDRRREEVRGVEEGHRDRVKGKGQKCQFCKYRTKNQGGVKLRCCVGRRVF